MSSSQAEKAAQFVALHQGPGAFVIPNPWDAGSARILTSLGFSALATSSSASAGTLGRVDYALTRDEALSMAKLIVNATDLPVSADLEDGFGKSPETVAETVRLAAETGLAGCSIEDAAGGAAPYDFSLSVERIHAAVEAARALPFPFVLTARVENYARENPDLEDTLKRLRAFEAAGADVLFAPGLPNLEAVRIACAAVSKPVNVVGSMQNGSLTVAELAAAGVKRISLATAFYRAALTGLRDAALEVREAGSFRFASKAIATAELNRLLGAPTS